VSVVLDILRTWRAPRAVSARRMEGAPREDRALAILLGGCALVFIAQLPRLAREAWLDPTIPFDGRMAGALFGWLMLMPLVFYALAALIYLILRAAGAATTGYRARMALFWGLLASSPAWLLAGLMAGFAGESAGTTLFQALAVGGFLIFAGAGLVAAARTGQEASA
jgi:uncharacterized membrane protein